MTHIVLGAQVSIFGQMCMPVHHSYSGDLSIAASDAHSSRAVITESGLSVTLQDGLARPALITDVGIDEAGDTRLGDMVVRTGRN